MKTNLICVLLLSFFLVKMDAFAQKAVIKVACVGNSITYGANIPNRNKNSTNSLYSKKVGKMIGDTDKQTQFNKSVYSPLKRTRSFVKRTRSFKKRP
jgi:sialate O-acetylesterase